MVKADKQFNPCFRLKRYISPFLQHKLEMEKPKQMESFFDKLVEELHLLLLFACLIQIIVIILFHHLFKQENFLVS